MILDTITRSLEVDLNGAVTTNQLPFVVSYVDIANGSGELVARGHNNGTTNNTTAVTLIAAPAANVTRHLKFLSLRNADTVAAPLWIQINDNSTLREIWRGTLAVGDSFFANDTNWWVLTTSGSIKSSGGVDGPASSTDNALVRWDGTGGTNIQNSGWTLADTEVLTAGGNIALGANYISRTGTAAGFSLDASNNATLSAQLTVAGALNTSGQANGTSTITSIVAGYAFVADRTSGPGSFGWKYNGSDRGQIQGATTDGLLLYTDTGASPTLAATFSGANTTLSGTLTVSGATITTGSTTALSLATSSGTQVKIGSGNGTIVNNLTLVGSATTARVFMVAEGTDTNVDVGYATRGSGVHDFFTAGTFGSGILSAGTRQLQILHTASATNYATITGSNGGDPNMGSSGGNLSLGASAAVATSATAGLIRIPTCAGTPTGAVADGNMVIDTTNHKLYFRSGATWRDAGP